MNTISLKNLLVLLATILTVAAIELLFLQNKVAFGSAPPGLQATVATSTTLTLSGGSALTLIATTTCSARIVSTGNSAIMLTFSDYNNPTPTGLIGTWQAASTTVVYDSGQYGCGKLKAFPYASSKVRVTSTN